MAFWLKKRGSDLRAWDLPGQVGTVSLPVDFIVEEEDDSTLLAHPKGKEAITLRFSSISFQKKDSADGDAARPYLKERAAEAGLQYDEVDGKGVISYKERSEQDGVPLVIWYWEIGNRNTLVIVSATIVESRATDRGVRKTLDLMPSIVATVRITVTHKTLACDDHEVSIVEHEVESSEQDIRPFGDEEDRWLAGGLEQARVLGLKYGSGGIQTPEELDAIFAQWMHEEDDKETGDEIANALGAAFGDYLVEQHGFRWVVVTDQYGTEYATRHSIGETMAFPRTSVQRRIADNNPEVFRNLHLMIVSHLRECESQAE